MTVWVERSAWTGAAKGGGEIGQVGTLFVHHTVGPAVSGRAALDLCEVYRRQHVGANGWADIGYSWLATQAGELIEGRGWGRAGAHTSGHNSTSYAVAWMGDSASVAPTTEALRAIADLYLEGVRLGWLAPAASIGGHRDVNATACPGDLLHAQLHTIRAMAAGPQQEAPDMTPDESARLARIEKMMVDSAMAWPAKAGNVDVSQLYANIFEATVAMREALPVLRQLAAVPATLVHLSNQVDAVGEIAKRPIEVAVHVVQPGETMREVADRVGAPLSEVMRQAAEAGGWRAGLEISNSSG